MTRWAETEVRDDAATRGATHADDATRASESACADEPSRNNESPRAPAVSVIVPAYNTASYIKEALDSALAQTFTDHEIVVVNDGSPDTEELERVLERYRERVVYIKQENRGTSAARNTAIRAARGRYIALLDSDDIWEPGYLQSTVRALEDDPTIDVVYTNALLFGDSPLAGRKYMEVFPTEGEVTFERVVTQEIQVFVGITARREALVDAGLFDESLRTAEDCDLWLRVLHRGGRIAYSREPLVRYRQRRGSHTSDPVRLYRNAIQMLDKVEGTMKLTPGERETVAGQRARMRAMLRLCEGKKAFFEGDARRAVEGMREANAVLKSRKLALLAFLLPLAPRLFLGVYNLRDRFVLRSDTKF